MSPQEKAWIKIYLNKVNTKAIVLEVYAKDIQFLCAKLSKKIAKASL